MKGRWRAVGVRGWFALVGAVATVTLIVGCSTPTTQRTTGSGDGDGPAPTTTSVAGGPSGLPSTIGGPTSDDSALVPPSVSLGPPPTDSSSTGPTSTTASKPTTTGRQVAAFLTPSRNIDCGTIPGGRGGEPEIACQVFQRDFSQPSCGSRGSPAGQSLVAYLTTTHRPTTVACAGDVAVPASPVSAAYGDRFGFAGGTACTVSSAHVRCVNRAGHGFELSRQAYRTF